MDEVKTIKFDLIDAIMNISDLNKLKTIYQNLSEYTEENDDSGSNNKIPTVELKSEVTLSDIKSNQDIQFISYSEIEEMVNDEEWKLSLEELLNSID